MDGPKMSHDEDEAVASINIVPLVDVILVVLIIFMVTAVFSTASALEIDLPEGRSDDTVARPPAQITVGVDENRMITVNGIKTDIDNLHVTITSMLNQNTKTILILYGDEKLTYGGLMPVLQEISGIDAELTLAYEPPNLK